MRSWLNQWARAGLVSAGPARAQPSPQKRPTTRKETRTSSYVWPTVYEPPTDDATDCDKSPVEPAPVTPVKTPAAVGKPTLRKGLPKSADRLRGKTSDSAAGAAGKAKNQWDVTEDEGMPDPPRSTPKPVGTPRLRSGGPVSNEWTKLFPERDLSGPEGETLRRTTRSATMETDPTSPPGGV